MQTTTPSHINNFNFLRFTVAVLVIISQSFAITVQSNIEQLHQPNGNLHSSGVGLTIFFFTSGYFVPASANKTVSIGRLIKKGLLRIYPALIVLLFISIFITGPLLSTLSTNDSFKEKETWIYLFTAASLQIRMNLPWVFDSLNFNIKSFNSSWWTIALEIQLYFSITIAFWFGIMKNKNLFAFVSLPIVFVCFGIVALKHNLSFTSARKQNLIGLFYLEGLSHTAAITKKIIKIILLLSALLLSVFTFFKIRDFDRYIFCLLSTSMLTYCMGFTKTFEIQLSTDISYVQQTIFLFPEINNSWILVLTSLIFTFPLAFASRQLIEKKIIRDEWNIIPNKKPLNLSNTNQWNGR